MPISSHPTSTSLSTLAKNLVSDGTLDRTDVTQLIQTALQDGTIDTEEKQALKEIDWTYRTEVYEGGDSRRFSRWYLNGIQDYGLAQKALKMEQTGGRVGTQEAEQLIQHARQDGTLSQQEIVTIRTFMLDGIHMTSKAKQHIREHLPAVIRPYERIDLAFKAPNYNPRVHASEDRTSGSFRSVEESIDDGWTQKEIQDERGAILRTMNRIFSSDGHLEQMSVDLNGDGQVDEIQRYLYEGEQLIGVDIYPAKTVDSAKKKTEIRYNYDRWGRLRSEVMHSIENPHDVQTRKIERTAQALHTFDRATQSHSIQISGDSRTYVPQHKRLTEQYRPFTPLESSPDALRNDKEPNGTIVREEKTFFSSGQIKKHTVETQDTSELAGLASEPSATQLKAGSVELKGFSIPSLKQGEPTHNASGQLTSMEYKNQKQTYTYDDKGNIKRIEHTDKDEQKSYSITYTYDNRQRITHEMYTETQNIDQAHSTQKTQHAEHQYTSEGQHTLMRYDSKQRLVEQKMTQNNGFLTQWTQYDKGQRVWEQNLDMDVSGRILKITETYEHSTHIEHTVESMQYDTQSEKLTQWKSQSFSQSKKPGSSPILFSQVDEHLSNDALHHVLSRTHKTYASVPVLTPMNHTLDTGNNKAPEDVRVEFTAHSVFHYEDDGRFKSQNQISTESYTEQ